MKEYEISLDGCVMGAETLLGAQNAVGSRNWWQPLNDAHSNRRACSGCGAISPRTTAIRQTAGSFPHLGAEIAPMAIEIMIARPLSYYVAGHKDSDARCDPGAGMAKLLGARAACTNADDALPIHGGNGFALKYPITRTLCDARILKFFAEAGEIHAQALPRGVPAPETGAKHAPPSALALPSRCAVTLQPERGAI